MKERFERMTLDQLDAIHEVMCYLYPPTESIRDDAARYLWDELEEVRNQKTAEWLASDEYKQKCKEADDLYQSIFLTQAQLADVIGVDQAVVSRWKSGKVSPNAENMKKLKGLLGGSHGRCCEGTYLLPVWERIYSAICPPEVLTGMRL